MNSVPDLHRQEKDEQNRDTEHRSTGRDKKWNKPDSDQNCPQISREAEPPEKQARAKQL